MPEPPTPERAPVETTTVELEIQPTSRVRSRVIALITSGAAILFALVYLLVGGTGDFFARRATLTTYMADASGVVPGSEVRLSGIRIGKVQKVELSGQVERGHEIRAEMRVLSRYLKNIPADSQTDVSADTLVGFKFIDIAEGKSPLPIHEDSVLPSEPVQQASDRANLMDTLQRNLSQVDQILADMSSPATETGRLVVGEQLYDTILADVDGFDSALHTFLTPQSDLGKAFYTDEIYNRVHNLAVQLDRQLASIQNGEGAVGHLFASDEQYNQIVRELVQLRTALADANAGKGKFGAFLQDDSGYGEITRLLAATDAMISSLNAGEGQAGRLLSNAQLYESLNGSLRSMEDFLRDLRENPRKYLRIKPF